MRSSASKIQRALAGSSRCLTSRPPPSLASPNYRLLSVGAQRCLSTEGIPKELWSFPSTEVTTLSNGIRVATSRTPDETATVGLWVDSGSRNETWEANGTAHFLEHMVFKGTAGRSRLQLEQEIENIGAHLNAYTSREHTVYYGKVFKDDLGQMMGILGDIIQHSKLDTWAMEEERHTILREMKEVESSHEEVVFDRLHQTVFRESSLGFTILGPEKNIRSINQPMVKDYISRHYTGERMVVVAVGNVDHKKVVEFAEENFKAIKRGSGNPVAAESRAKFVGGMAVEGSEEAGQMAHLAVGWEGVPWTSPDSVAFMLFQSIIGQYRRGESVIPDKFSGNRAVHALAHNKGGGGAEHFTAFNTCYRDTGLYGFYVQAEESAVEEVVSDLIAANVSCAYSVTEEDVFRGKLGLQMQVFGALDGTTALAEDIGRQLLVYGRRMHPVEFLRRLEAIDADEVKRVAWKCLHDRDVGVIGIGAVSQLPEYEKIRRKTCWMRE